MSKPLDLVVFTLDKQHYALPVSSVVRVVRSAWIPPLPNSPKTILGVINIQGKVLPVINLCAKLNLPDHEIDLQDQMILVKNDKKTFVMIVNHTHGIEHYLETDVSSTEELIDNPCDCVTGIIKKSQNIIFLLDPNSLFHSENEWLTEEHEKNIVNRTA